MRVLVLNGGSSGVKAAVADVHGESVAVLRRSAAEGQDAPEALFDEVMNSVLGSDRVEAVGHRVVHGGLRFRGPERIDAEVEHAIEALVPLAPLHNPVALAGIRAARARFPDLPMVAAFDTAFHRTRSTASMRYALPDAPTEELGLWRYGFHGIAHASLAAGAAMLEGKSSEQVTMVTLQLGRGCSACAIERGRSVETSMGFTPLEGLMMGTRSGDVDPGLVLHLLRAGRSPDGIGTLLEKESGLVGVGGSADMRELLRREEQGDGRAGLAIEMFVRRIVATCGAYFTLLDGDGSLVFGGGIGENSPTIRERICSGLRAWNVRLDRDRNRADGFGRISEAQSRGVYVVRTDEEAMIAGAVARVLAAA